jgi:hypothetical protein
MEEGCIWESIDVWAEIQAIYPGTEAELANLQIEKRVNSGYP